jgi:Protein of unknown function (DUF1189)
MAFYSRELYRDVAKNWGGSVFLYLFILLALCWIPNLGKLKSDFSSYMHYEMPKLISQIPQITVKDGVVSVDADMPYTITDPSSGKPFAILDTTGSTQSLDDREAVILLTRDKLILKKDKNETREYSMAEVKEALINQDVINNWLESFNKWFFVIIYPFALLFSYAFRLLQVLLYAAIGIMYDRSLKAGLGYSGLLRVAAVAITPAVILNTVRFSLGFDVSGWSIIMFISAMAYIFFGVAANAPQRTAA